MQKKFTTFCVSFNTRFGWITISATSNGLREIKFTLSKRQGTSCLQFCGSKVMSPLLEQVKNDILHYLAGRKFTFDYPLDVSFTLSQAKVFSVLKKVAYGTTISYKELAKLAGTSPRACGRILASNPLPIIIPCHRVICANGKLGGFSGGIQWKKNLLKIEGLGISGSF